MTLGIIALSIISLMVIGKIETLSKMTPKATIVLLLVLLTNIILEWTGFPRTITLTYWAYYWA